MPMQRRNIGSRPLLSVEDAAVLLGETRSTLYRAIKAGTLPLPVFQIGARMRIPRKAVEQLIEGHGPPDGLGPPTPPDETGDAA
jgi:excisionase family DNA binding protein